MKGHILIVEDEIKIAEILKLYLEKEGFRITHSLTGTDALSIISNDRPDLIILDLILPDMEGEELCSIIKKEHDIPILMLTAKSSEDEKVRGLDLGADDYVVKPFSPKELMARIRAILRRTSQSSKRWSFNNGGLVIDLEAREVISHGKPVSLTNTEFRILAFLAGRPSQVFTREEIIRAVLGYDFEGYDRTVDAHIKNIRQKIEKDPAHPVFIKTLYGIGYKFAGMKDNEK